MLDFPLQYRTPEIVPPVLAPGLESPWLSQKCSISFKGTASVLSVCVSCNDVRYLLMVQRLVTHSTTEEEAWRRGCGAGSHTHGRATPGHISLCLQISSISAPSCRVPCPDGIKLQSLGNVRFRNWRRKLGKMTIATTSSS